MRAFFIRQPEFAACASPFRTVRRDSSPTRAIVRKQVGEFMAQCALDFSAAEFAEARIQPHEGASGKCDARRAAHPRVPLDTEPFRQRMCSCGTEQFAGFLQKRLRPGVLCVSVACIGNGLSLMRANFVRGLARAFSEKSPQKIELHGGNIHGISAAGEHCVRSVKDEAFARLPFLPDLFRR